MAHRVLVRAAAAASLVGVAVAHAAPAPPPDAVADAIAARIASLRASGSGRAAGEDLSSVSVLPRLYARRDHAPLWSDASAARSLLGFLRQVGRHGLDPRHYHLAALEALEPGDGGADAEQRAARDLLLTDALVRVAGHLAFGKVDPDTLTSRWDLSRELDPGPPDLVDELQHIVGGRDVAAALEALAPASPFYAAGRRALARTRAAARAGGWPRVPAGPALEAGVEGARVRSLRRRLAASGDLAGAAPDSPRFDEALRGAVERFQRRHGLEDDGVVGRDTLAALNVGAAERAEQIRVNLERARWVLRDVPPEWVVVDIADFAVRYERGGAVLWESRAVVGCPTRPTPVLRDTLEYVEINPSWIVPPGILDGDVLPRVREDVGYLERHRMRLLDASGAPVDPEDLDWSGLDAESLPYRVVQAPGRGNPLGRIKFGFPNRYLVYMHDTPSRAVFDEPDRALSSGCVRLERPFELAALLLGDAEPWSRERLLEAADSGETLRIDLPRPVPIVLLYATMAVDADGDVRFRPDVYDRDAPVLVALRDGLGAGRSHEAPAPGEAPAPR